MVSPLGAVDNCQIAIVTFANGPSAALTEIKYGREYFKV
jgi:hypothetical protein